LLREYDLPQFLLIKKPGCGTAELFGGRREKASVAMAPWMISLAFNR
jgi:hypothetical protein